MQATVIRLLGAAAPRTEAGTRYGRHRGRGACRLKELPSCEVGSFFHKLKDLQRLLLKVN